VGPPVPDIRVNRIRVDRYVQGVALAYELTSASVKGSKCPLATELGPMLPLPLAARAAAPRSRHVASRSARANERSCAKERRRAWSLNSLWLKSSFAMKSMAGRYRDRGHRRG
jgi:hypothetical protein